MGFFCGLMKLKYAFVCLIFLIYIFRKIVGAAVETTHHENLRVPPAWHTDDVDDGQSFLKAEKEMRVEIQRFIVTFSPTLLLFFGTKRLSHIFYIFLIYQQ